MKTHTDLVELHESELTKVSGGATTIIVSVSGSPGSALGSVSATATGSNPSVVGSINLSTTPTTASGAAAAGASDGNG